MQDRTYLLLLVASWIVFFVFQVTVKDEALLTLLSILFSVLLLIKRVPGELTLFAVGLAMGLIIEVGLGLVSRSQHWENASLLGVPYWLPIIWGYGFVALRRIGNIIVQRAG